MKQPNNPPDLYAEVSIRKIEARDNVAIAKILRDALKEHGADKPGTAYFDKSTDEMHFHFQGDNRAYFVAEINGLVAGGVGIYPTEGLPDDTCELVKMYIDKDFRGIGIGKKLIGQAIAFARAENYARIYLESMPELAKAVSIYEHFGFRHLHEPLGNTGHYSCPIWMLLEI